MKTAEEYAALAEEQLRQSIQTSGDNAARFIARAVVYADLARLSQRQPVAAPKEDDERPLVHPGWRAAERKVFGPNERPADDDD